MTKQIGQTIVPDDLYNYAKFLKDKGAKVFLSTMGSDHTGGYFEDKGCTNCNGTGKLMLEYYVTAPMDTPPVVQPNRDGQPSKNPTTGMWDAKRQKWFGKNMRAYDCPACIRNLNTASAPREINL